MEEDDAPSGANLLSRRSVDRDLDEGLAGKKTTHCLAAETTPDLPNHPGQLRPTS